LDWVDALRLATEDVMSDPAAPELDDAADGGPRFFTLTDASGTAGPRTSRHLRTSRPSSTGTTGSSGKWCREM
jgi:hypothetical protein